MYKRCCCSDPETGKRYGAKCPQLKKTGHGSWWFRYDAPRTGNGKRRRPQIGPFSTKEEAEQQLVQVLAGLRPTAGALDHQLTVSQWLQLWLNGKIGLKGSTLNSYREAVGLYLEPGLGHLRLVDLRDHHVSELYAAMLKINRPLPPGEQRSDMLSRLIDARADSTRKLLQGETRGKKQTKPLSPARIRRIHAVLNSAMNSAVKKKYLTHNPAEHVELPRMPRRRPLVWTAARVQRWEENGTVPAPVMVWTPAQTGAFLDFIQPSERLYALFHLVALRGLRRAEVAGLPWSDLDLDTGILTVRETRPDDDSEDTKSDAGDRIVALDSATTTILRGWRAQQENEKRMTGPAWTDSGLVFTRPDGTPLRPAWISQRFDFLVSRYETIRHRYLVEGWILPQIGSQHQIDEDQILATVEGGPLPPVRFHDLRHGAATLSLAAGVEMKVISETLGHARSSFTADIYASVIPKVFREAAEATAAMVPRRISS
ncbi:site-specific integrase [Actinomadura cremea]|nr:site-specific integrase [Actinomadura cremea]